MDAWWSTETCASNLQRERDSARGDARQVPMLELEGSEMVFGWESLGCVYVRGHETSRSTMR